MDTAAFKPQYDFMDLYEMAFNAREITEHDAIPDGNLPINYEGAQEDQNDMSQESQENSEPPQEFNTDIRPSLPYRHGSNDSAPTPWNTIGCITPVSAYPEDPAESPITLDTAAFRPQYNFMDLYEMAFDAREITEHDAIPDDSLPARRPGNFQDEQHNNSPEEQQEDSEHSQEGNDTNTRPSVSYRHGSNDSAPTPWNTIGCITPVSATSPSTAPRPHPPFESHEEEATLVRTPSESGSSYFPYTPPASTATAELSDDFGYTFEEYIHDMEVYHWRRLPEDHPERIGTLGLRTVCSIELIKRDLPKKACPLKKLVRKVRKWKFKRLRQYQKMGLEKHPGYVGFVMW